MFSVHVPDFESVLGRLSLYDVPPIAEPFGDNGQRRVCLRDPDGNVIEVLEFNPLSQRYGIGDSDGESPTIVSVTISVPDLVSIDNFWIQVLECDELDGDSLHTEEHEALWGMSGARRNRTRVLAVGTMALEFVSYQIPQAVARSADYRISDQGILNVAVGSTNKDAFDYAFARAQAAGFRSHAAPWTVPGLATVAYFDDSQGISVEFLHVEPQGLDRMGFIANSSHQEC